MEEERETLYCFELVLAVKDEGSISSNSAAIELVSFSRSLDTARERIRALNDFTQVV